MRRWLLSLFALLAFAVVLPVLAQELPQPITAENIDSLVEVGFIPQPSSWVLTDMAWSPEGTRLAFTEDAGVWTVEITPEGIRPGLKFGESSMGCVAWSPDGSLIASCSKYDGGVQIWDSFTGEQVAAFVNGEWGADDIKFSPDGTLLAVDHYASDNQNGVAVWGVWSGASWQPFTVSNVHTIQRVVDVMTGIAVTDFGFSPDSRSLYTATSTNQILFWTLPDGEFARSFDDLGVYKGRYSPDGRYFAVLKNLNTVQIMDAATFEEVAASPVLPEKNWLVDLDFSPDSRLLAVTVNDGVFILDVATGDVLAELEGHPSSVWRVGFSPDGTLLASLGLSDGIRLWGYPD